MGRMFGGLLACCVAVAALEAASAARADLQFAEQAKKPAAAAPSTSVQAPAIVLPSPASSDGSKTDAPATIHVNGFRSAKFGMSETEVRAAIAADFNVKDSDIKTAQNPSERTQILTARVADVLQDGGAADVSYVFGYKSRKLIQVTVLWSKSTDESLSGERLFANAETLRSYFLSAGYEQRSVLTNVGTPEGILFFRGADADKHLTVLLLRGASAASDDKQPRNFVPSATVLIYLADAQNPDVFKVQPGKF